MISASIFNVVLKVHAGLILSISLLQRTGIAGWLPGRNFLSRYLQEKQIQRAAPKKCYCHPPVRILYITCSYGLGRKPISILCIRFASSHCLHLPILPTPPTSHAVASHLLLVPRNFMPFTAPTAANISSCLVISAAKTYRTFQFYKNTSR
jgi:hypothetical protein